VGAFVVGAGVPVGAFAVGAGVAVGAFVVGAGEGVGAAVPVVVPALPVDDTAVPHKVAEAKEVITLFNVNTTPLHKLTRSETGSVNLAPPTAANCQP
jgi:hypothetical protein